MKKKYDDGRTIAPMDLNGSKWEKNSKVSVGSEEKRALIWAAFRHYLPVLLCIIIGFAATAVLIYLWLQ